MLLLYVLAARPVQAIAQDAYTTASSYVPEQQLSSSSQPDVEQQIRTLDRHIVLELLKLADFNVRYEQAVNHYARWRTILYPSLQEACYACFLGFSVTDISQRSRGWSNPALISIPSAKRALSAATVGACLGGGSSMIELVANGAEAIRVNRKGFSVRDAVSFAHSQVERVDNMLAQRHYLMGELQLTGTRRELLELKEQLLMYERDRLVFELKRWIIHSRGYAWFKNTFYVVNASVNACRFSAALLAFKSFTAQRYQGGIGPLLIASSCVAGVGPATSELTRICIERHQKRYLSRKLPVSPFLSDEEAKQKFERLAKLLEMDEVRNQNGQLASEVVRLREEKIGLDTLVFHEERKIQRIRKVVGLQEKVVPVLAVAGTTSGILSTVGYYGYRGQPVISNRLRFAGDACLIPAEAVALIATPGAAIRTYLYERDLKRKGEHPDQLLAKRLKDLKTLEALVKSWQ